GGMGGMRKAISRAVLESGGGGGARGVAHDEQVVGPDQRSIGVADLVGLRIEQVEEIDLDPPAIVEPVAKPRIDEADRRRTERVVFGERGRAEIAPAQRSEPAGRTA